MTKGPQRPAPRKVDTTSVGWRAKGQNMVRHKHRAVPSKVSMRGFVGYSVRPEDPNPVAHGGFTVHDQCGCGAVRLTDSTGDRRTEVGTWFRPRENRACRDSDRPGSRDTVRSKVEGKVAAFSSGKAGKIVSVQVVSHDVGTTGTPTTVVVWYWEDDDEPAAD